MNYKIETILFNAVYREINNIDWDTYKINITNNFNNINFSNDIENYIPCGRKLYVTRPRMRVKLYDFIVLNKNIFIEMGYSKYYTRDIETKREDIYSFIEDCIKILVKKQQEK